MPSKLVCSGAEGLTENAFVPAGTSTYADEGGFLDVMWQAMAPSYGQRSTTCWAQASPAVKFAVCVERNHLFKAQPGPSEMKSRAWPCGRPAGAMEIVRELMTEGLYGLEADADITSALARWVNHVPALPIWRTLWGVHTW